MNLKKYVDWWLYYPNMLFDMGAKTGDAREYNLLSAVAEIVEGCVYAGIHNFITDSPDSSLLIVGNVMARSMQNISYQNSILRDPEGYKRRIGRK